MIQLLQYYKNSIILGIIQKVYIPSLKILSKKYFYAWRMLKVNTFLVKTLKNELHDYSRYKNLFNYFEFLDVEKVWKLIQITNWKNYEINATNQPWFDEWIEEIKHFKPTNENDQLINLDDDLSVSSVNTTSDESNGSTNNTNLDSNNGFNNNNSINNNTNTLISEDDRKWFARLFAKYAEQNNNDYSQNNLSPRRGSFIRIDNNNENNNNYDFNNNINNNNNNIPDYDILVNNPTLDNDELFGDALNNFNMENFFKSMDPMGIDIDSLFQ